MAGVVRLRAVPKLLRAQPLIVRRRVAPPPHEVVLDTLLLRAVEQQLHLVLALLPLVCLTPGPDPVERRPTRGWA